ncbi:MAG: malate/lactate/ureidoglycolate dehydrogenase [Rhodospirillaceae bacterium]|nr:malate/lactate/ureidoglycolate dehydrogenase [Rhodospirillaceae bacterium]
MTAILVPHAKLRALVATLFEKAGSPAADARRVADHLVDANLAGHDSHGVQLVKRYIEHIQKGLCRPGTKATCVADKGAVLQFDGGRGFGICVATEAMTAAMARCATTGIVLMTLRNAHHIGRVGAYAEMALAQGLISIHFVNVTDHPPMVAPFRGRDARFGTNPVCIGIPGTARSPALLLDMATSAVAVGKVVVAKQAGQPVPENAVIDAQGQPTTDPARYFGPPQGALLPFGLHKGYGLMLAAEILAGVMSGNGTIQPGTPRLGSIMNNMFSIVIDPAQLADPAWAGGELDALIAYLKAAPTQDGAPVLVAGEPEAATRREREAKGIMLPSGTVAELEAAVALVGLKAEQVRGIGV